MDTKDAGRIGGKRRAAKMTPKQRSEAARLAVRSAMGEGKEAEVKPIIWTLSIGHVHSGNRDTVIQHHSVHDFNTGCRSTTTWVVRYKLEAASSGCRMFSAACST